MVSIHALNERGFRVVIAAPLSEDFDRAAHALRACPSFEGEGQEFTLEVTDVRKLESEALPSRFEDVAETRELISTTLRTQIFPGYAFWTTWAKPRTAVREPYLRAVDRVPRSTLYDLELSVAGVVVGRVRHALCLRVADVGVKFVHLTDLHLAARNDLWEAEVRAVIEGSPVTPGAQRFQNFNGKFRDFIHWANQIADKGELDFIWALGDLVDFARTGLFARVSGDSNWSTFVEMVTGSPAETQRRNKGLRVPLYTTTGNHDWRTYPYSPVFKLSLFGITKKCAEELDFWYRNTPVEIGEKLERVSQELMRKGSPLLARSWWGTIASMGVRGCQVGLERLAQRTKAVGITYGRQLLWAILGTTSIIAILRLGPHNAWKYVASWVSHHPWLAVSVGILFLLFVAASLTLPRWLYAKLRTTLEGLIAIEAEVSAIYEYFLRVNPYFNYAFQLENCYFIVLDTGPDCMTAQSFWDEGGSKVRRISIRDNILGGSPDTMGFYPANEYYPYSQISWLESVLSSIKDDKEMNRGEPRKHRIFVGLHAPPANLPSKERAKAEQQLNTPNTPYVVMEKPAYDIHYGTVNHYLSQFFYLCLGFREGETDKLIGPCIDVVFAGHAHWNMEFELRKPQFEGSRWSPDLLYGKFSTMVEATCHDPDAKWGPLLLQTAACGPQGAIAEEIPPNFRYVVVIEGKIYKLRPCKLTNPPQLAIARAAGASAVVPPPSGLPTEKRTDV
jgi:hypothetical protein